VNDIQTAIKVPEKTSRINYLNFRKLVYSVTIFIKKMVFADIGYFDELLGVGARFPATEESDLIIRCLEKRKRIRYFSDIIIHHPFNYVFYGYKSVQREQAYGLGIGYLIRKHFIIHKNIGIIFYAFRSFCAPPLAMCIAVFRCNPKMFRHYFISLRSRIRGLLSLS
jgi:hypothetical protein